MTSPSDIAGLSERLRDAKRRWAAVMASHFADAALLTTLDEVMHQLDILKEWEEHAGPYWESRALRAEQQRDEAYERAAKVAETPDIWKKFDGDFEGNCIAAAIRRLASGPDNGAKP